VLLTGSVGYTGGHATAAMLDTGYIPVLLDEFSDSDPAVLAKLKPLTGRVAACERWDVLDTAFMRDALQPQKCFGVVHLAGLEALWESVAQLLRHPINVGGLVSVLQAMQPTACRSLLFSSSTTVYGDSANVPVHNAVPCPSESSYARSKLKCEEILRALQLSATSWRVGVHRCFNSVAAQPSELIGEDPSSIPNNPMPYGSQVAVGKREELRIFGNDYLTGDGTGVRDYLHVTDLAEGDVAALRSLLNKGLGFAANLGTGRCKSVLGAMRAFEQAGGRKTPHKFLPRRSNDVAKHIADVSQAKKFLDGVQPA